MENEELSRQRAGEPSLSDRLRASEARGRQYSLELAEKAGRIRELEERVQLECRRAGGETAKWAGLLEERRSLEAEVRLLRRERVLLIDLEKGRSRVIGSLLSVGGATADDVNFIRERSQAVAALHLEASGGIERPEGSACACILCAPQRTLGKYLRETVGDVYDKDTLCAPRGAGQHHAAPVGKALPPEVPAAPPEEPLPTAEALDLMRALKASLAASKPRKPEEGK